jgi:autophagy-related protein 2
MNWQRMCPEFLKKRLFRYLLQHFLGSFFKEKPSLEQLTIDMFNGTAKVESLHLDCEFLNEKLANLFSTSMPIEIV